jgi:hypothetical protein
MRTQPVGQDRRSTLGHQVDRPARSHVDQHGGVHVPAAQRDIIHTEHHRPVRAVGLGKCSDSADQRVPAHRNAERARHAGSGACGQRQTKLRRLHLKPRGVAGVRPGQTQYLLGERHHRAPRIDTREPAHPHRDAHPAPRQRQIRQRPLVSAVCPR